jgi:hypothetical protein
MYKAGLARENRISTIQFWFNFEISGYRLKALCTNICINLDIQYVHTYFCDEMNNTTVILI